jgi:hypothetical protein
MRKPKHESTACFHLIPLDLFDGGKERCLQDELEVGRNGFLLVGMKST